MDKSHQDDKTPYEKLSPDVRLKIDADQLATDQHKKPHQKVRKGELIITWWDLGSLLWW